MSALRLLRRRPAALSCQEMVELVTDYFDGALSRTERRRFDAHIASCDGCTAYIEQLRVVHEQAGQLTASDIPPDAEARLREAFSAWRAS